MLTEDFRCFFPVLHPFIQATVSSLHSASSIVQSRSFVSFCITKEFEKVLLIRFIITAILCDQKEKTEGGGEQFLQDSP
jgi:hypothetical protein